MSAYRANSIETRHASGYATHLKAAPGKAACGLMMTAGTFRMEVPARMVGRDGVELDEAGRRAATYRMVTCRKCRRVMDREG